MFKKVTNRKAYHEYHILKEYVAGMELLGSEVKSLRLSNCNLTDSFCFISNDEIFLKNLFISKYNESSYMNHDERRLRKLLLHKKEIKDLFKKSQETGITIIPLEIFTINGRFKMKIALAQGKKLWDKRESLKQKDQTKDMKQSIKSQYGMR